MQFFRKLFRAKHRPTPAVSKNDFARPVSERIAEEFAQLQALEFERIVRGDPSYGSDQEEEIIWRELLDLEAHQADERIDRRPLM